MMATWTDDELTAIRRTVIAHLRSRGVPEDQAEDFAGEGLSALLLKPREAIKRPAPYAKQAAWRAWQRTRQEPVSPQESTSAEQGAPFVSGGRERIRLRGLPIVEVPSPDGGTTKVASLGSWAHEEKELVDVTAEVTMAARTILAEIHGLALACRVSPGVAAELVGVATTIDGVAPRDRWAKILNSYLIGAVFSRVDDAARGATRSTALDAETILERTRADFAAEQKQLRLPGADPWRELSTELEVPDYITPAVINFLLGILSPGGGGRGKIGHERMRVVILDPADIADRMMSEATDEQGEVVDLALARHAAEVRKKSGQKTP